MKLRPYQSDAVTSALAELESSRSTLGVAATGLGKAQPIDEPVLTPFGWEPIGSLRVGDRVIGSNGQSTRVAGVYPQGVRPVVEVTFSDGAMVRCDADHLWAVRDKYDVLRKRPWRIVAAKDINTRRVWRVPMVQPMDHFPGDLPLDPYILGVLIGDGGLSRKGTVLLHTEPELAATLDIPAPCRLHFMHPDGKGATYLISSPQSSSHNTVLIALRSLGLMGLTAHHKHVPPVYLHRSSAAERLELLRGIMDTDGHVRPDGHVEITIVSDQLAKDIAALVRSLGGTCRVYRKATSWTYKGIKKHSTAWRCSIALEQCPFRWKAPRWRPRTKYVPQRSIKSIRPVGTAECVCIAVEAPDSLYVTRDYVLTHNTVIAAHIIKEMVARGHRVLVIAHREELIRQAARTIATVVGEQPEIEMADERADLHAMYRGRVVVASKDTLIARRKGVARMHKWKRSEFGFVWTDEAHHAVADSYGEVYDYFLDETANPAGRHLGVTATPDRTDELALGQIYNTVAFDYDIRYGIEHGWLVPIRQRFEVVEGLDYNDARAMAGDLNQGDIAKVQSHEAVIQKFAATVIKRAKWRKTLVFATPGELKNDDGTSSFKIADRLTEVLRRYKPDAAKWVSQDTPKDERRQMLSDFAARRFQFLVNVGVLTEGFDDPGVEVVAMTRPTKSRSLYAQMIGRGTRVLPGVLDGLDDAPSERRLEAIARSDKPFVEVVDFVGSGNDRHKLVSVADILGGKSKPEAIEMAKEEAKQSGVAVDMDEAIAKAEKAIKASEEEKRRRKGITAEVRLGKARVVDPFNVLDIDPPEERAWDIGKAPTDGQLRVLESNGIDAKGVSRGQAGAIIQSIFDRRDNGLCTYKQAKVLKKYGYPAETTFENAKALIDAIAANGWRRPAEVTA